jgi:hypothetical protein
VEQEGGEMTNEQMIRELRAVAEKYKGKHVFTCETNVNLMATDAANRIESLCDEVNRQKAEIDRQDKEIERLNGILENYAFEYGTTVDKERFLKKARDEAAKEFAEMLKEYTHDVVLYGEVVTMSRINNLVKEFTEGGDTE